MNRKNKIMLESLIAVMAILAIKEYRGRLKSIRSNGETATIDFRDGDKKIIPLEDDRTESKKREFRIKKNELKEGINNLKKANQQGE